MKSRPAKICPICARVTSHQMVRVQPGRALIRRCVRKFSGSLQSTSTSKLVSGVFSLRDIHRALHHGKLSRGIDSFGSLAGHAVCFSFATGERLISFWHSLSCSSACLSQSLLVVDARSRRALPGGNILFED